MLNRLCLDVLVQTVCGKLMAVSLRISFVSNLDMQLKQVFTQDKG